MDTISYEKYNRIITRDANNNCPLHKFKRIIKEFKQGKKILQEVELVFEEFFVNGEPLSEILDKWLYTDDRSILDNNIGVLGSFCKRSSDIIKVNQVLGKQLTDKEITDILLLDNEEEMIPELLENHKDELSNPEVIIYCSAECGDYMCGGVSVHISFTEKEAVWTIEVDQDLVFRFEKYQYYEQFKHYLTKLKKGMYFRD